MVATTARNRELVQRILTPRQAATEMRGWIGQGEGVGIMFGPERTGLENEDMVHADTALSIPLNPQFSSLNMAQAGSHSTGVAPPGAGRPEQGGSDEKTPEPR